MLEIRHNNAMSEFVDALKWWLEVRQDLTPTGISRQAGLDKTAVRQMIVMDRSPRIDTALKICGVFGVTLDQFLARDADARRAELLRLLDQLTDSELEVLQAAARGIADKHRSGSS
jgi:transcriptional regulator with XRE-family HTH domain